MHKLEELQKKIIDGIAEINLSKEPRELYHPITYTLNLGGKRLRPALCLLACDAFDGNIDEALEPALGIEMFHNFTLLHDDIMDEAPLRRGKPTVHEKWDANTAILSGDTMMALSYEYIMRAPKKIRSDVFSIFNETAIEVCEGQQYDMNFENLNDVTIADYINMIRLKTAVLLAGSLKIGALIGGADEKEAQKLYDFGENIGIAFQLMDDLLDVFSDQDTFGKISGGDIIANKKTYLYLKALELSDEKTKNQLIHFYNNYAGPDQHKVESVKEIYAALQIREHTEKESENYYLKGLQSLSEIQIDDHRKSELKRFTEKLRYREK